MRPLRSAGIAAGLVALPLVLGRLLPGIFTSTWMLTLGFAFAMGAATIGLNVVMGYAGQISLGHAAFLGVGAFTTALIIGRAGAPFLLAVPAAAAVTALIALPIGLVSLRIRGLYLAISTLGFGVAMFDGAFKTGFITGGTAGVSAPRPVAGDFVFLNNADYLGLVMALLLIVWWLDRNLVRTKLGRAFQAIREDEEVAATLGIDVPLYKTVAFVIAGAFTGVAGAAYAPLATLVQHDNFPFQLSVFFVIFLVIGGMGSRVGAFLAASLFTVFPRLLDGAIDLVPALAGIRDIQFLVGALLLLLTLVIHPGGFAQGMAEAKERRERRLVEDTQHDAPVMAALPAPRGATGQTVAPGEPMLEVQDLGVRFGGLQAVDGATFEVPTGKIVGLIGPNGAGKTTCFNAVSGLVKPTSGRISFKGEDITELPAHARASRGMGRTFQLLGLAKNLSVTENLLLAQHRLADYPAAESLLRTPRIARTEDDLADAAREALAALGFEHFADQPLRTLSHGQQRLVELASALITSPDILLLDEPSGGMAPNAAESLAERLIEIRDRLGRTVLLIEHHIPLVMAVCDTVHVLSAGRILASGTTDEIVRDPGVIEAYLGTTMAERATAGSEGSA